MDNSSEFEPVTSSNVAAFKYEIETNTLSVAFVSGRVYEYFGVPSETVDSVFKSGGSIGSKFYLQIRKGGYQFQQAV